MHTSLSPFDSPARSPLSRALLAALTLGSIAGASAAQGPAFESPGTPSLSTMGQSNRFSTEFNPAIGVVIDTFADYVDADRRNDGLDAHLRLIELNAASFIDPNAWAYVAIVSEDGESPEIEEAAVEYIGLPGNQTVKAGRFFVDFGKQMQQHLEELRTLERPLPLREYLGAELSGVGAQYDNWVALDDETPVRFSLGVFSSLLGEGHGHGEEEEEEGPEAAVPDRKDFDELSVSARVTGMRDVGESGVVQVGASARFVPEFTFEDHDSGLEVNDRSNRVYGVDATYACTDETGNKKLLVGGEALLFDGDLAAELDDPTNPTAITVVDDEAFGFFVFGDCAWDEYNSAGVQYAQAELAENPRSDSGELDLYYTRNLTELRRLRVGITFADEPGPDSVRLYVQFTNFFGNHAHGLNW